MGGVCRDPEGQYFVWSSYFYLATQECLLSYSKPNGDATINNLELGMLIMHLLLFASRMETLAHIHTYVDNMAAQGWANRGSARTASSVGPILREISLVERRQHIHASIGCVPGEKKRWRMLCRGSLTFHTRNFSPISIHTSRRESLDVCPPCHPCAGDR